MDLYTTQQLGASMKKLLLREEPKLKDESKFVKTSIGCIGIFGTFLFISILYTVLKEGGINIFYKACLLLAVITAGVTIFFYLFRKSRLFKNIICLLLFFFIIYLCYLLFGIIGILILLLLIFLFLFITILEVQLNKDLRGYNNAYRQGDFEQAAEYLEHYLKNPKLKGIRYAYAKNLCELYIRLERYEDCRSVIEKYKDKYHEQTYLANLTIFEVTCYIKEKNYTAAENSLVKFKDIIDNVVEIHSQNILKTKYTLLLVRLMIEKREFTEVPKLLESIPEKFIQSDFYIAQAAFYEKTGDYKNALLAYKNAIDIAETPEIKENILQKMMDCTKMS